MDPQDGDAQLAQGFRVAKIDGYGTGARAVQAAENVLADVVVGWKVDY
jgi:hypothetical protein